MNGDRRFGEWCYAVSQDMNEIPGLLNNGGSDYLPLGTRIVGERHATKELPEQPPIWFLGNYVAEIDLRADTPALALESSAEGINERFSSPNVLARLGRLQQLAYDAM